MIKAIFFDIDGTLVSLKAKTCSPSTRSAVEELRRKGILCFVATGRSKFEIAEEHLLDGLVFDGYLTNNGQDAYDAQGGLLYGTAIDERDAAAVLDWVEREHCACWMVSAEDSVMNHTDAYVDEALIAIHTKPPRFGDLRAMLAHPIYKIVLFLPREEVRAPLALAPHCRTTQWYPLGHDIISRDGGKRNAMLSILQRLGIDASECMAFGDSENDVEMLREVGIGVAMGNATPDAIAAADYVTDDCDDDGLRNALLHFGVL